MKQKFTSSFVPNLLTLGNLFCGFASVVYSFDADFKRAAIFVVIGAFFDLFDGVVARLIGVASEFGGQLDSLSDVVTFGLAPSILLYQFHFHEFGEIGILLSSVPALFGALRLARFNVQLDSLEDKKYFVGMPIPSSAMIIISYVYFNDIYINYISQNFIYLVTFMPPMLMISNVHFVNMPRPSLKNIKKRPFYFSLFFGIIVSVLATKFRLFMPYMVIYMIIATVKHIYNWINLDNTIEVDFEEFIIEQSEQNE
ncbi:CDP-diacylglycerol--serine O-phosphatidyltransferase [Candidatus Kapabacteria bacterium]|nr:CDP-diacylglycerol--serine O-phosphatidyltransferase [Candidatus Kapabacteria bacterium]